MNIFRLGAKKLIETAVGNARISSVLCHFRRRPRILMIHGVGTLDFPASVFRRQLSFLVSVFRIVPLQEVWRHETSEDEDSRPKLALTFDDGLRNNFSIAYPVLQEHHVPAVFFVCPGVIESRRWLWNNECRARLCWVSIETRAHFARSMGLDSTDIEPIVQKLKYLPYEQRLVAQKQLRQLSMDFTPTEQQRQRYDIMTWQELRSLDPEIVTIGGHSSNHQILTQLETEHLESEVGGCRSWLERELGRRVRHFCYPDGAYNAEVLHCVSRHFESAVTTKQGWLPSQPSLLELPRIPIADNLSDLIWRIHRPTA
jgi:peptidoglycan/xylan/chitin deacetylase (PgdA/CDA1 family)